MTSTRTRSSLSRSQSISLPDMGPIASLLFLLIFYMLAGHFRQPEMGVVSLEKLPQSDTPACLPDNNEAIISLDELGHYSFSVDGPLLQAAALQKVAARHHIGLSAGQLQYLPKLNFLTTGIAQLPKILAAPSNQNSVTNSSTEALLSEAEAIECVQMARYEALSLTHKPVYVALMIHAEASATKVMQLLGALQQHGITRFNLKTQAG